MVTWLNEVALQICSIRSEKRQTDDPETAIPCVLKICNLQRMHIFASFILYLRQVCVIMRKLKHVNGLVDVSSKLFENVNGSTCFRKICVKMIYLKVFMHRELQLFNM